MDSICVSAGKESGNPHVPNAFTVLLDALLHTAMTDNLSNIHLSKDEFGLRMSCCWFAEYFDNVGQYDTPSMEPGVIRICFHFSSREGRVNG